MNKFLKETHKEMNYGLSKDRLTLIEAVHFWPYFSRGTPSGQALGALGQISVSSCKSLDGGSGGADAGANDVIV